MSQPISLVAGFCSGAVAFVITQDAWTGVSVGVLVTMGVIMLAVAPTNF